MLPNSDRDRLENAIKQPIAALTAAIVESPHAGRDIVASLLPSLGTRPHAVHPFRCLPGQVGQLLSEVRDIIGAWPQDAGVLFLLDETAYDAEDTMDFWKAMNLQRENWGALKAHIVFLLNPGSFEYFHQAADHLASWVPLKLDLRTALHESLEAPSFPYLGGRDNPQARGILDKLEAGLAAELLRDNPSFQSLARRYYLPMLDAAVSAGLLDRAEPIFQKLNATPQAASDKPRWLVLAIRHLILGGRTLDAREKVEELLEEAQKSSDAELTAMAYAYLGIIARARGEYSLANAVLQRALEIWTDIKNDNNAAAVYCELGGLAMSMSDYDRAARMLHRALALAESANDEIGMAAVSSHLGYLAYAKGDLSEAERHYRSALMLLEHGGITRTVGTIHHRLGMVYAERADLDAASESYRKALECFRDSGDHRSLAATCHQLGNLALEVEKDFPKADAFYQQALAILLKLKDDVATANTYHQLGIAAQAQGDYTAAKEYLRASLDLRQRMQDMRGAAYDHAQLGSIGIETGEWTGAAQHTARAAAYFRATHDSTSEIKARAQFTECLANVSDTTRPEFVKIWVDAGLEPRELELASVEVVTRHE